MNLASRWIGLVLAFVLTQAASVAQAGPLPLDGNALGGANQGTQTFQNKGGPTTLTVDVEFAVYAPGQFTKSFGAGSDPSGGTDFVYAYEAFNRNVPPLARSLASFTVSLLAGAGATNIEYLPTVFGSFGLLPASSSFGGSPSNAARWDFTGQTIGTDENSQVLLFTSPNPPTEMISSVVGGGLANSQFLPSPIPEPASWALLVTGSLALVYRRLRARRI
jgi:hypothetical protein